MGTADEGKGLQEPDGEDLGDGTRPDGLWGERGESVDEQDDCKAVEISFEVHPNAMKGRQGHSQTVHP